MEALKILRRIAYYLLFIVASTLFFKELVSLALVTYTEAWGSFSYELLLNKIYLPVLYATICLALALLSQGILIGRPREVETSVYPWALIIYFGIGLVSAIIILAIGLVKIPNEPSNKNPFFLVIPLSIAILFTAAEVLWGTLFLFREKKKERLADKEKEKTDGGVDLHKSE